MYLNLSHRHIGMQHTSLGRTDTEGITQSWNFCLLFRYSSLLSEHRMCHKNTIYFFQFFFSFTLSFISIFTIISFYSLLWFLSYFHFTSPSFSFTIISFRSFFSILISSYFAFLILSHSYSISFCFPHPFPFLFRLNIHHPPLPRTAPSSVWGRWAVWGRAGCATRGRSRATWRTSISTR